MPCFSQNEEPDKSARRGFTKHVGLAIIARNVLASHAGELDLSGFAVDVVGDWGCSRAGGDGPVSAGSAEDLRSSSSGAGNERLRAHRRLSETADSVAAE